MWRMPVVPATQETEAGESLELVDMGFHHVSQDGLDLLTSLDHSQFPRLECSGAVTAHCNLEFRSPSAPPASASHVAGTKGMSRGTKPRPSPSKLV
ncbi:Protein PPP5D1, partial [Plecturocebus cupreus]